MKIIGHRGARGLAPENTLQGFEKAIEHGVDMVETDIRLTKDGILVLVHNSKFSLGDTTLRVANATYAQLKQHNVNVPTLETAIRQINRRTRMMLEIKTGVPTKPVVDLLRTFLALGWQPGDFMFNSTNYETLKELYQALPEIDRIIQGNWSGMRVEYLARKLHTPYILLDQRYLWWGYVYLASKKFRLITYTFPWTKSARGYNHFRAEKWQKYGLYGMVTDYPDHFEKQQEG